MEFEIWGATQAPQVYLPVRTTFGLLLTLAHLLILGWSIYRLRDHIAQLGQQRRWLTTSGLAVAAFILSQFIVFSGWRGNQLLPGSTVANMVVGAPFAFVPVLIAGISLNPIAAMLVAFAGGLARMLWQTHQIYTPFYFAIAGMLAGWLVQQNYQQYLFQFLRRPLIAGILSLLTALPFIGLATFAYADPTASWYNAFDVSLSTATAYLFPIAIEGLLAGLLVALLLRYLPDFPLATTPLTPSPSERFLKRRLISNFLTFAFVLTVILLITVYGSAQSVSKELVVEQMAHNAGIVANNIPNFINSRQNLLQQYGTSDALQAGDPAIVNSELRQLFRTGTTFRRVILVTNNGAIKSVYPNDDPDIALTDLEKIALDQALRAEIPTSSAAERLPDGSFNISFIVPAIGNQALVGRIPDISFSDLTAPLQDSVGQSSGFLVNDQGQIISHNNPESLLTQWSLPLTTVEPFGAGLTYEGRQGNTNARELVYYLSENNQPWTVVTTVPYEVVLAKALFIVSWVLGVVLVAMGFFTGYLLYLSDSITKPLVELGKTSQNIADGSLDTPITRTGDDEIGQLAQNFQTMQRSLKQRMGELRLLLDVSEGVSSGIDLRQNVPPILRGTLRGTNGASGVRMIVRNPISSFPLTFGEGPASDQMQAYDRQLMMLARDGELICPSPEAVRSKLDIEGDDMPFKALIAIPLQSGRQFQGVYWVAFRQPRELDPRELDLLHTLAGQASVVMENWTLFYTAQSGRRRLAAVLASTTDAVLVTDQTNRVILLNPAMEKAFGLPPAKQSVNRPLKAVLRNAPDLLLALNNQSERRRHLEVVSPNGITWSANISPIMNANEEAAGRVVVLHDITQLKEVEELKTEFVQSVSHDLRTPLTYMRGYANMLPMWGDLTDKQTLYMEKILVGLDQMEELVTNVLDLGRIEGGVDLVVTDINMVTLVDGVTAEFADPLAEAGLDLVVELPDKLPKVTGDANLLRQAMANLIGNAIKYAPNSGKFVVNAGISPDDPDTIYIKFQDNGAGIPAKDLPHIFDRFYRVKERERQTIKGSGLGLAIVQKVAERHGGKVWCESSEGEGCTFVITLPIKKEQ